MDEFYRDATDDEGAFFEDDFDPDDFDGGGLDIHTRRDNDFDNRIGEAKATIKRHGKFSSDRDVDEFLIEYNDIAGRSSPNSGNLLHTLVEVVKHHADVVSSEGVGLLVRRLVERFPELLRCPNKDNQTPVFMAIRAQNDHMVICMLSACTRGKISNTAESTAMKCLDDALRARGQDRQNSLHVAFKELQPNTIKKLVEYASDEALAEQDGQGKTPLHHAVQIRKFLNARVELIAMFIRRDLKAIQNRPKTFLDIVDHSGCSVYREQKRIREIANEKRTVADLVREHSSNEEDSSVRGGPINITNENESRDEEKASGAQGTIRDVSRLPPPENEGRRLDHRERLYPEREDEGTANLNEEILTATTRREDRTMEHFPNSSIKRINTGRLNGAGSEKSSGRSSQTANKQKILSKMDTLTKFNQNSDKMLLMLKLHYMRTRTAEKAISFIHGTNMDDIQISFDYDGLPRKMIWNEFIKRFGADSKTGLKFDRVLQNVTFPHVQVQVKGRLADIEHDSEQTSGVRQLGGLGRKDMKYFFDWLYAKGVRHIIRVTVNEPADAGEKAHSDKAIQESLERFVIEHLDWQKKDLDPETILCVSSRALEKPASSENPGAVELHPDRQLKSLFLRWGGSNAVLRAWSEPEGLPMLPRLQKVYLYRPPSDKSFDNPAWIDQKLREFRIRLNKNVQSQNSKPVTTTQGISQKAPPRREIEVIVRELGADEDHRVESHHTSVQKHSTQAKGVNSHRWLDCTSRFASEMLPFWKDTLKDFRNSSENPNTQEGIEKDVIVALIDDGIDIFDTTLSNQVLEGKSFDFHDGKVRPPFASARGHGTVMANMILRVCPMAKIYPIRLKTYKTPEGKSQIDRDYAAQAIKVALDKKATIISMSWTLPMLPRGNGSEDKLHKVLQEAVDRQVLMFCSSPDEGNFKELDYPSGPWRDRFFRIGAAGADGRVFAYTPDDGITFVLPGVDVVKGLASTFESAPSSGITGRVMDFKYETGSSVATALAAGLAAMIIYCVKASILAAMTANQNKNVVGAAIPKNGATLVAEHDAMQQAFRSLGTVTSSNFVQIWEELDKVSEMLENARGRPQTLETKRDRTESFVEFGKKLAKLARRD